VAGSGSGTGVGAMLIEDKDTVKIVRMILIL
jgi:hypothetical protein